jgi:hypothetical protein
MYAYTLHGHLQIDNNAIKLPSIKHEVNLQVWLMDVLQKLNDPHYEGKFSDLLPHRWKNYHA